MPLVYVFRLVFYIYWIKMSMSSSSNITEKMNSKTEPKKLRSNSKTWRTKPSCNSQTQNAKIQTYFRYYGFEYVVPKLLEIIPTHVDIPVTHPQTLRGPNFYPSPPILINGTRRSPTLITTHGLILATSTICRPGEWVRMSPNPFIASSNTIVDH
jgi:hypothetical protein